MGKYNISLLITLTISCASFYLLLLFFKPFEKAIKAPKIKIIGVLILFVVYLMAAFAISKLNISNNLLNIIKGIFLGLWVSIVVYLTDKPKKDK